MDKRILIVDDSLYMRTLIKDVVQGAGYEVVGLAANGEAAIDMALDLDPDLITLDNILPDMIGLDILKVLKEEENIKAKIVMVSAVGQQSVVDKGMANGAFDYIVKPFTNDDLLSVIERAFSMEENNPQIW